MKLLVKISLLGTIAFLSFFLWMYRQQLHSISWDDGQLHRSEAKKKEEHKKQQEQKTVMITRQNGEVVKLPLETYLEGVVGSEMPASFEMEALKAQAVAARTFATKRNYRVDDSVKTQVYHDDKEMKQIWGREYTKYHARVTQAIKDTKGEIITYQGEAISAVFFSGSCGRTANSEEYWEGETPYLRSVESPWDKAEEGYQKQESFSAREFANALGFTSIVQQVGTPQYYASGYVDSITIDHIKFSGRKFREAFGLRSSSFQIKKDKNTYVITTKGFGHGLGLSQYGAQGMAQEGASYKDILQHYYTGVKIAS